MVTLLLKALFHLLQKLARELAASISIQSQCSEDHFNEMQALAASFQVGFAITGKEPLKWYLRMQILWRGLCAKQVRMYRACPEVWNQTAEAKEYQ